MHASIAFNRELSTSYRWLGILAPEFGEAFRAGQFLMVRPPLLLDPLLPRAFSIYRASRADGGLVVEILYKIVGKGTHYLAQMEPGQSLEILGPLGNGFSPPEQPETAVLVAGGIGVPPIAALAREMVKGQGSGVRGGSISPHPSPLTPHLEVFLGGRTAEDILCLEDFEAAGARVHIATEDGSAGTRGLITDLLDHFLRAASREPPATASEPGPSTLDPRPSTLEPCRPDLGPRTLFCCGPPGMLAAVACLAEQHQVPCQTSVEANMACGFGACMGCAIALRTGETGSRYALVCKDGPVFDSRLIDWGGETPTPGSCSCQRSGIEGRTP